MKNELEEMKAEVFSLQNMIADSRFQPNEWGLPVDTLSEFAKPTFWVFLGTTWSPFRLCLGTVTGSFGGACADWVFCSISFYKEAYFMMEIAFF